MVKVFEGTKNEFSMDGYFKQNLDIAKTVIKKDWDMVFVYDGAEGSGKSVKAMQDAFYCDPTLTIENVVFTPKEFRTAIQKAKKYQSIIYDEAYTGLSSRATMSMINRTLISMLAEIRQKNLFVFVVMPCFFDLDKYVALWRSRALIHIYTGKDFTRGFFSFYNAERKKSLYMLGKKYYNYFKPEPNFRGRFLNHYVVDEQQYKLKKRGSLVDREKKVEDAEKMREVQNLLFQRVMDSKDALKKDIPNYVLAKLMGISEVHFYRLKQKYDEGELI